MKSVFVSLLLIAVVLSARPTLSKVTQKRITDLQGTRFGKTLFSFAQLHSAVQGPIDELTDAIAELIADLNEELQELEFNFQRRTNEHNALVVQYSQDIGDAETDVARTDDTIQNLLIPRKQQIQTRMAQLNENMVYNRQTLQEETLVRHQETQAYEANVAEYNEAIEAVDEAIALLQSLVGGAPADESFIQIKQFKKGMARFQNSVQRKMKNGPFLQAMISLASNTNFSDAGLVQTIVDAMNEFRNDAVDAINNLTAQEADTQSEYEQRVIQLDIEFADFQANLNDSTIDYNATVEKINELYAFLNQRDNDRKQYLASLQLENETYVTETEIYTDLKNQYLQELAISEQAFALVDSAEFGSSVNMGF